MRNLVRSAPWLSGAWWEAELPEGWAFRQDMSIKNFPDLFESPGGSRLWVYTWGAAPTQYRQDWWHHLAPDDLTEYQKEAFQHALIEATQVDREGVEISKMTDEQREAFFSDLAEIQNRRITAAVRHVTRRDLGVFVGFTFPKLSIVDGQTVWAGYFPHYPWMIRVIFAQPSEVDTADDEKNAFAVLASMRFREPKKRIFL